MPSHKNGLVTGWTQTYMDNALYLTKLDTGHTVPHTLFCLSFKEDMTWMMSSCGIEVTSGSLLDSLPPKLDTVLQVISTLTRLNHCRICSGNEDGKFQELQRNSRFLKFSGIGIMYISMFAVITWACIHHYLMGSMVPMVHVHALVKNIHYYEFLSIFHSQLWISLC